MRLMPDCTNITSVDDSVGEGDVGRVRESEEISDITEKQWMH